ncbi:MAG: nucleotide-binding protein, partial [Bryobacterales bacterium]|nr:nucleotide-binding protein [Bryobacterales bacterium]
MLVLDANILIRAVLGSRVLGLLRKYAGQVELMAPDVAFEEAREHLPDILAARKIPAAPAMAALELVAGLVQAVERETYSSYEAIARERIDRRDEDDWPVLAAALAL